MSLLWLLQVTAEEVEKSELEKNTIVQNLAARELTLPLDEHCVYEEIYEEIQDTGQTGSDTTLPAENVSTCAH